jgi:hypothetical protein
MTEGALLELVELVRNEDRALAAYRQRMIEGKPHETELALLVAAVRVTSAFLAVNPEADVVRAYEVLDGAPVRAA